jgi:hypothetical protein
MGSEGRLCFFFESPDFLQKREGLFVCREVVCRLLRCQMKEIGDGNGGLVEG